MHAVAGRLKQRRKQLNLTQREVGERAGLSQIQVGHYEYQVKYPCLDTLMNLAAALECTVDYLLGRVQAPLNGALPAMIQEGGDEPMEMELPRILSEQDDPRIVIVDRVPMEEQTHEGN